MKIKKSRGGAREGAGRKPKSDKRVTVTLSVQPVILTKFKSSYGRKWSRRVEQLMAQDSGNPVNPDEIE